MLGVMKSTELRWLYYLPFTNWRPDMSSMQNPVPLSIDIVEDWRGRTEHRQNKIVYRLKKHPGTPILYIY